MLPDICHLPLMMAVQKVWPPPCFGLQVASLRSMTANMETLKLENEQLVLQASEMDRLAAMNSELRLIGVSLAELQDEHRQLEPQAQMAQELKRQVKELEEDVLQLPAVKVSREISGPLAGSNVGMSSTCCIS